MNFRHNFIAIVLHVLYLICIVNSYKPDYSDSVESKMYARQGAAKCPMKPDCCPKAKYRTLSGACNNLNNPLWASANTRYGRMLKPNYGDGISTPSRSVTGEELPNALELSRRAFGDEVSSDLEFTLLNVPWGQFVAHDMSGSDGSPTSQKQKTECCTDVGRFQSVYGNKRCMPIKSTKYIKKHGCKYGYSRKRQCTGFTRTTMDKDVACSHSCPHEPAEQRTLVSGYMDLSVVYGNDEDQLRQIREKHSGRLTMTTRHGHKYPLSCPIKVTGQSCYLTGDPRSNQNPGLSLMHLTYVREHNRIADELRKINACWNAEKIFQEARRINIAAYQRVNYYEWFQYLLGRPNLRDHKLIYDNKPVKYINDYNPKIDASIYNEHGTAAYRFFHTNIRGHMKLMNEMRSTTGALELNKNINNPKRALERPPSNYDSFIRGLATQPQKSSDTNVDPETRDLPLPSNNDLRAIDIQRGRDHGLAAYNLCRKHCNLTLATDFNDFSTEIPQVKIDIIREMYRHVNDVDLMVGGSLEKIVNGTLVGPTFLCILLEQFYRSRIGDRYFFERGDDENIRFTIDQLTELHKASGARLMCDNGNNIQKIQKHAFVNISEKNKVVPCSEIPGMDLTKWKDDSCTEEPADDVNMGDTDPSSSDEAPADDENMGDTDPSDENSE